MMFVCDMDGTLLNSQKQISVRNRSALCNLEKSNHKIVIATARPPRAIDSKIASLGIKADVVYYNGALIRFADGSEKQHSIDKATLQEIRHALSADCGAVISIEENDRWYAFQNYGFAEAFCVKDTPEQISQAEFFNKCPNKILINNYESSELLKKFSNQVNIVETDSGSLLQIMSKSASKETGVKDVATKYGIDPKNICCFGDDNNDIEMFRYCGTSVAMQNAVPTLKAIATAVTQSNDDDGVAVYLENLCTKDAQ